jgi:predicted RNA-binding protein with PUA-like domain
MRHWLMKTEPDEFSIDTLAKVGREPWSGVRNYQARNYMTKDMRVGDGVLIYHSGTAIPGVAGVAQVASEAYPDPTQFDRQSCYHDAASPRENPRWWLVDIAFERKLARLIALDEIKAQAGKLGELALLQRGNRLSVLPLTPAQWKTILSLE